MPGTSSPTQTTRDVIALISGALADAEPALDTALDDVLADLEEANPMDVTTAFAGITIGLINNLARATDRAPADVWQPLAHATTTHYAHKENEA